MGEWFLIFQFGKKTPNDDLDKFFSRSVSNRRFKRFRATTSRDAKQTALRMLKNSARSMRTSNQFCLGILASEGTIRDATFFLLRREYFERKNLLAEQDAEKCFTRSHPILMSTRLG